MTDLAFPIEIRPDMIVKIVGLPHDLTKEEAERIARIVIALAVVGGDNQQFAPEGK